MPVKRSVYLFAWLAVSLGLTGCFSVEMRVQLQPDGQGKIIEKVAVQKAFLAQMQTMIEGFGQQMGAAKKAKIEPAQMFSEKQAKERVAALGPGVKFVSCKPISTAEQEGMESVYTFTDVSQLKLGNPSEALSGVSPIPSAEPVSVGTLRLEKLPGGKSRLTILPSEQMQRKISGAKSAPDSTESKPSRAPTPEELEQVRKLFSGMRFAVSVELMGRILTPSHPCLTENRINLLEMDMDKLMAAAGNFSLLGALNSGDPASIQRLIQQAGGIDGMKICLSPDLQVEFTQ